MQGAHKVFYNCSLRATYVSAPCEAEALRTSRGGLKVPHEMAVENMSWQRATGRRSMESGKAADVSS